MALIDITPVMTSNNTPAPYIVTESSYHLADMGYKIFDRNLSDPIRNFWHSSKGTNQWVKIDYFTPIRINAFSLTAHMTDASPKDYKLQGSLDNTIFNDIYTVTNDTIWEAGIPKLYKLEKEVTYRYYRLTTTTDNGYGYIVIREMNFYQDDYISDNVTNSKASLLYCLPSSPTESIRRKILDPREGLLGYANDPDDRYGTLWMVNHYGNAIIPKASMLNADILFSGNAGTKSIDYILSNNITAYRYIVIVGGATNGTNNLVSTVIPLETIPVFSNTVEQFSLALFSSTSYYYRLAFSFGSEKTFRIINISNAGWTNPSISYILGFK